MSKPILSWLCLAGCHAHALGNHCDGFARKARKVYCECPCHIQDRHDAEVKAKAKGETA